MAKRKNTKAESQEIKDVPLVSKEEVERRQKLFKDISIVLIGLLSIFSFICILLPESTGVVGKSVDYAFRYWFGIARYLFPFLFLITGISFFVKKKGISLQWLLLAMLVLYVDASVFAPLIKKDGGLVGNFIAKKITETIGIAGGFLFTLGIGFILFMIITQISLAQVLNFLKKGVNTLWIAFKKSFNFLIIRETQKENSRLLSVPDIEIEGPHKKKQEKRKEDYEEDEYEEEEYEIYNDYTEYEKETTNDTPPLEPVVAEKPHLNVSPKHSSEGAKSYKTRELKEESPQVKVIKGKSSSVSSVSFPRKKFKYRLPSLDLLNKVERDTEEKSARDYSRLLEETLANFGVEVKVINKVRGPTVTRYELQPAKGVKVKKVTNLASDIALALAAYSIRIEAPIPGKSAIGIEVPNHRIDPVFLRDILKEGRYRKQPLLSLALGKDITGKAVMDDLLKMPHLLIAGATGSGKSVCLNCLIASILYKATPDQVQLVMVDPKRVELSLFEGIPHLVNINLPGGKKIITDPKAATLALKTISEIMDQRYEDFVSYKVRNIKEYNKKAEVPIPYIVVIIDELADLMMVSSSTVEQYICRIAQLGRASGIHLIVATQRPSVDVITGLIKANIPSRIAFAVSSQVDSRTILDRTGAEKLLGKGDMLYSPVDASEPRRIQGAYVSGEEIERIVDFWKVQPPPENAIPIEIEEEDADKKKGKLDEGEMDVLVPEAIEIIRRTRQASVSNLQRKMKIGYARAGRIMDQLEKMGIVGPAEGSKPRKILLPDVDPQA